MPSPYGLWSYGGERVVRKTISFLIKSLENIMHMYIVARFP